MAREARRVAATGAYHIVLRGNDRLLFVEESDYRKFLEIMRDIAARDLLEVCAYCLFSEAVHLVLKEGLSDISLSMKNLISSYAIWCNAKYARSGKLFYDRFASEPLESDSELLDSVRYVHKLPPARKHDILYEFSSYGGYLKKQDSKSTVMLLLDNSVFNFKTYTDGSVEGEFLSDLPKLKLTDEQLKAKIKELLDGVESKEVEELQPREFKLLIRRFKKIEGTSIRQLARVLNLSKSFVERS